MCHVTADTHEAAKLLKLQRRPDGKTYFKLECEIMLLFRDTEMQAQICWTENVSISYPTSCAHRIDISRA